VGLIYWVFLQLVSYGVWPWLLFVAIALASAYLLRVPGIFFGHLLVAIAVVVFDVQWIQSEMRKPGWDGQPDQDLVFMTAMVLRIVLVNMTLLPISILAMRVRKSLKVAPFARERATGVA
jgi:4-amino-4-deoxy-L-arabinose transferase-like glycosyltransferase